MVASLTALPWGNIKRPKCALRQVIMMLATYRESYGTPPPPRNPPRETWPGANDEVGEVFSVCPPTGGRALSVLGG